MTRILGIDTGQTTGVALIERLATPSGPVAGSTHIGFACHYAGELSAGSAVNIIDDLRRQADIIALERWTQPNRKLAHPKAGEFTRELIGHIRASSDIPVVLTNAGGAKAWANNERLRLAGLWHPSGHVRDSMRHALFVGHKYKGWPDPVVLWADTLEGELS